MLRELKEATMVCVNQSFFNMKYLQTFSLSCEKNTFCIFWPYQKGQTAEIQTKQTQRTASKQPAKHIYGCLCGIYSESIITTLQETNVIE